MQWIESFVRDEDGQDLVEFGLQIATIANVVLLAAQFFGSAIAAWFQSLATRITTNI
jgi:Flp pilus assembly pilin Flp